MISSANVRGARGPERLADRRAQVAFIRDAFDPSFDWRDAEWLCQEWGDTGPVALKGVVRPDDALRAVDCGFDAVWVSNHGGRQLETAPAPIDVLPSIRDALGGMRAWAGFVLVVLVVLGEEEPLSQRVDRVRVQHMVGE